MQANRGAISLLTSLWSISVQQSSAVFHATRDPMNFLYFLRPTAELETCLRRIPSRVWGSVSRSLYTPIDTGFTSHDVQQFGVDLGAGHDVTDFVVRDAQGNIVMQANTGTMFFGEALPLSTPTSRAAPTTPPPDHPEAGKVLLQPMRTVFGTSVQSVRQKDGTVATRKAPDTGK